MHTLTERTGTWTRELGDMVAAVPFFLAAPLVRPWHARWGATDTEVAAPMPGDDLVPGCQYRTTRAPTIAAAPEDVWPWLVQVGFGRAGFYSVDLLDNLGRPSAQQLLPQSESLEIGQWVPMSPTPSERTAFQVHGFDAPHWLLWAKPDSTWCWSLQDLGDGRARLVARIRTRYDWRRPADAALSVLLMEVGDFAMLRRMLLGIRARAEQASFPGPSWAQELIEAAVQAPSSHNTQPYRFRLGPEAVEVLADRSRALPVNDPDDRELTISCGAAVENLMVAARARGFSPTLEVVPDQDDPDLLARVLLQPERGSAGRQSADAGAAEEEAAAAIPARRTHRGRFTAGPSDATLEAMASACAAVGVGFHVVTAEDRATVAQLVAEGDRAQFADAAWRRELAHSLRPRRRGDGLTGPPVIGAVTRLVVTHFDVGKRTARSDQVLTRQAPAIAVLTTADDDVPAWLQAGQALQRALLVAATEGVQAGYANQACQVAALRPRLREALSLSGRPQLVLRLGVPGNALEPTPRRPVAGVLEPSPQSASAKSSAGAGSPNRCCNGIDPR